MNEIRFWLYSVIQYSESEERQINETGLFPRIMEAKYLLSSLNLKTDIFYAFISWLSDWKCTAGQKDHCSMTRVAYHGWHTRRQACKTSGQVGANLTEGLKCLK